MDIWQLIERDRGNIAQLIHEAPMALNGHGVIRSRERSLADLIAELEMHVSAIEASLFDLLSSEPIVSQLIEELRADGSTVTRGLVRLSRYRQKDTENWLNTFEDTTYQLDQYLHRTKHELIPMARSLLSTSEVREVTSAFIQKKISIIRRRQPGVFSKLVSNELGLGIAVCAIAAGFALFAKRRILFSKFN